ncbi:MAG: hypothetical protein GY906_22565 [bacterium]|nr:hypothetical protein [bacterium]
MSKRKAFMDKLKTIFCAVFRHSNIEEQFWGEHYCGRCRAKLGDSLAGVYRNSQVVGIHCDCEGCRERYAKMGWMDKFLAAKPEWLGEPPGYAERKRKEIDLDLERLPPGVEQL